jgi:cytoskeletal protein CcmA (bactofilin family)
LSLVEFQVQEDITGVKPFFVSNPPIPPILKHDGFAAAALSERSDQMLDGNTSRDRAQPGPSNESKAAADERRMAAWIGTSLVIQGKVISTEDLTINGQVEGTIELGDHSLIIGVGAKIQANLVAKAIVISGTVTGNIRASDKVDLRPTGSVDGDIITPRLVMADGAIIKGRVDARGNGNAPPTR